MNKHILLIDDDEDEMTLFTVAMGLAGFNYELTYACNMQVAMQVLWQQAPDCVFIDLNMPKTDGLACIAAIRKQARYDAIPLIMYSTGADAMLFK